MRFSQIQAVLSSPVCLVLHCIAFAAVSKWCQESVDYAPPVPVQPRSAGRDGDGPPTTGRIHPRKPPVSALHMEASVFIRLEPRRVRLLIYAVQRL